MRHRSGLLTRPLHEPVRQPVVGVVVGLGFLEVQESIDVLADLALGGVVEDP